MKTLSKFFSLIFIVFIFSNTSFSQGMEMMEQMMKDAQPGPMHTYLKSFEGNWNLTVKFSMMPGSEMMTTSATTDNKMILGGRFLEMKSIGDMMGQTFEGEQILGYDNSKKKFFLFGIDVMGTYYIVAEGSYNETTKELTFTGTDDHYGNMSYRFIMKSVSDKEYLFEGYFMYPGMTSEFKAVEIVGMKQ